MAIRMALTLPGGLKVPAAYVMAQPVVLDRVRRRVHAGAIAFLDQATRVRAAEAYARAAAAQAEHAELAAELKALGELPLPDAPDKARDAQAHYVQMSKNVEACRLAFDAAARVAEDPALRPILELASQPLPPALAEKVLRADGTVDLAPVYEHLKQRRELSAGGEDVIESAPQPQAQATKRKPRHRG